MLRTTTRVALALAATVLLGAGALAQTVTPSNRVLVIDAGKSAKATIEIEGCDIEWSVENDNPGAFSVKGVPDKATDTLKLTVSADADSFPASGTVTVTASGGSCGKFGFTVELMVFSTMMQKAAEKQLKSITSGQLKNLKSSFKIAEKAYADGLKAIQDDLKDGEIDLADYMDDPDPGMSTLSPYDIAMIAASLIELQFYTVMYAYYFSNLEAVAFQAHFVLTAYLGPLAFLPYIAPLGFLTGGCGPWDSFQASAFAIMGATFFKAAALTKKFNASVKKALAKTPEDGAASEPDPSLADPGTVGADPVAGTGYDSAQKRFDVNKVKAWNHATDEGNSNGRIRVTGRATSATVDVKIERTTTGSPVLVVEDDFPVDTDTCGFMVFWPPVSEAGNLPPGSYRVTVTDASGSTIIKGISVPVR